MTRTGVSRRSLLAGALAAAACGPRTPRRAASSQEALALDVGQVLWIGIPGHTAEGGLLAALRRGAIGGIVLLRRNVDTPAQVRALCDALHAASAEGGTPVLIATDQEGGRVQMVREPATRWPAMAALGAHPRAAELARPVGRAIGTELAALGIDVDLAPVLDVVSQPSAGVIGDRAFGGDPQRVASLGSAVAAGLGDARVLACGKHFPGHGGVAADSHVELPVDRRDRATLMAQSVAPFAALAKGLPMLMTAHVAYPALGADGPATLAAAVLQDLLRTELGFTGTIVSDDLDMAAVSGRAGIEPAALGALTAGCDALVMMHRGDSFPRAHRALLDAASSDPVVARRLAAAAARVRAVKARHFTGLTRPAIDVVGAPAHLALAAEIA